MSDNFKEYVAGLAAGVATVVTGHPFDTVKVKLQAHNTEARGKKFKNAFHCAARILTTEGVKGLYRGASSSFVGMAFESSLFFGMYSQMKKSLQGDVPTSRPKLHVVIPSAGISGAIISTVLCPTELVKVSEQEMNFYKFLICVYFIDHTLPYLFQCRIQVQGSGTAVNNHTKYSGPLDCALKTMQSEGFRGIFRGYHATLLRESVGNAMFFVTYEYSRYYMHLQLGSASTLCSQQKKAAIDVGVGITSGGLSGIAFWTAVLPIDVAKTVIQTSPATNSSTNIFETLRSIYQRLGLRGCYTGLGPTIVRAFPANAAAIVTWESAAKVLGIPRA